MGWKSMSNSNFLKPGAFKKNQVMLQGKYLGKRPTQYGEALDFRNDAGEMVSIHGYQPLLQQLEAVGPNTECRVIYQGKVMSKNDFSYHNFLVQVNDPDMEVDDVYSSNDEEEEEVVAPVKTKKAVKATPVVEEEEEDDIEEVDVEEVEAPKVAKRRR